MPLTPASTVSSFGVANSPNGAGPPGKEAKPSRAVPGQTLAVPRKQAPRKEEESDAYYWLERILHASGYAGDEAMDDLFGKDGLFGDWGWREKIPRPKSEVDGIIADIMAFYLSSGPLGIGKWGEAAKGAQRASKIVKGAAEGEKGAAAAAKGARAEKGVGTAVGDAGKDFEGGANAEAQNTKEMARPHVCSVKCHCYSFGKSGAKCPPFVYGVGKGRNSQECINNAKRAAGATVPQGCNYRHCH